MTNSRIRPKPAAALSLAIITLAALAYAYAATLFSCARDSGGIGLFLYNEADPYIKEFARQIIDASDPAMVPRKYDAGNSQLIQNEQIESALAGRMALMMVNPVDRLGAYAVIKRSMDEDIPVIFFNREPLAGDLALWDKTYYVGAKAEQSGQLQAELVMKLFGGSPSRLNEYDRNRDGTIQAIILKGEQGHQDAEIRTREVLRSFEKNGFPVEVLALEIANWNREEAHSKTGRLIRDYGKRIELIVSNNDAMALGAISRMRQEGLYKDTNGNGRIDRNDRGWIPVVGIDGLKDAKEAIAEGYLYGTVTNDSLSMAKAMVALARTLVADGNLRDMPYPLTDGKYIWIDYRPFISD
jgi:methyl-galactoside transport system substrate-binding protein